MTKFQKYLLAISALLLMLSEVVKRIPISEKAMIFVGAAEILIAAGVGLAFGISTIWNPTEKVKE